MTQSPPHQRHTPCYDTVLSQKRSKEVQGEGRSCDLKELLQLHMKDIFAPQDASKLSKEQKTNALESLMFLKDKRDGTVKG
jgi:hypothetical protein